MFQISPPNSCCVQMSRSYRWTPLHCSSYTGHFHVVEYLLEQRADVNRRSNGCDPPLFQPKSSPVSMISRSCSQSTPLHCSSSNGHVRICRLLVEQRADVAAKDKCRSPPRARSRSLTPCVAETAKLRSNTPSTAKNGIWFRFFAASVPRSDAFARLAAPYCPHRKHHTPRRRRCFVAAS